MRKSVAAGLVALLWLGPAAVAAQDVELEAYPADEGLLGGPGSGRRGDPLPQELSMIDVTRPTLRLSLAEAVQLTLAKSLGTRIEQTERAIALAALSATRGGYDPLVQGSLEYDTSERSTTNVLESVSGKLSDTNITGRASVTQPLPIGGSVTVGFNTLRRDTSARTQALPEFYSSSLFATLNYPLLQNRGQKRLDTAIERAENVVEIADLDLRRQLITAVALTQNDYLDLILARENLEVQRESLVLARELLEIARAQERVGTLAPIEVLSAEAAVAAREENVIVAESAVLGAEDSLRTSLNLPESLAMWDVAIVPTDAPGLPDQAYDLEAAVRRAFEMRPDYLQTLVNLRSQRLDVELARNLTRPQLDAVLGAGLSGISQVGITGIDPNTGNPIIGPQGSLLGSHFEDLLSLDNLQWSAGLNFRHFLGNRGALGDYRISKLEVERSLLQLRNIELGIVAEVRSLLRAIETNRKRVSATRVAAELARQRLEAEQRKFQVGTATSFDVLQFQERLTIAETAQTQAIIDLNRAVLGLQQSLGLTLDANGIVIENGRPRLALASTRPVPLVPPPGPAPVVPRPESTMDPADAVEPLVPADPGSP
jgi:outer membrane protein